LNQIARPRWGSGALLALGVFCVIGDFFLFRTACFNSDLVQSFNELDAIYHGNFLLHGFSVATDSFYLTDLPFYLLGSLVAGKTPALLYIIPYIVFLLFLAGCCLLVWRAGATPWQRQLGVAAVLVALGIPYGWPQSVFLVSDEHGAGIMMSVFALLAAQSLLKSTSPSPGGLMLFCGLVFIVTASDQLTHAFFILPFFGLFVLRAWIYRKAARGEVLLLGFLFCAAVLGTLLPAFITRHGGFDINQSFSVQFTSFIPVAIENARRVLIGLVFLFDARADAVGGGGAAWLVAASRTLLAVGLAMLCGRAIWRLPVCRGDIIAQWLALGALVLAVIEVTSQFFALNSSCDAAGPPVCGIRFVAPVFVYLVLAGILQGQSFCAGLTSRLLRKWLGAGFAITSLVFLGGGATRFVQAAGQPAFAQNLPQLALAQWLEARGQNYGVSDYWTAPLVTALSAGRVKLDTVVVTDKIRPGDWIGDMADLHAGRRPQFVVFGAGHDGFQGAGTKPLDLAAITQAYGPPVAVESAGNYQVALLRKADQ
jgi:hypothetical protein